jgi:BRCT domain type II-containing protein
MEVGGALKGKRVSITGHLGRPRKDIVSIIERAEGRYDETPKCGTTYLVTNRDWTAKTQEKGASRKLIAAKQNGVKILSEQDFYDLIVANGTTLHDKLAEIEKNQEQIK